MTSASAVPSRNRWQALAMGLLASMLLGCANTTQFGGSLAPASSDLNRWVTRELTPYLTEQLSTHPRFRGQPTLVVGMAGADITPEIDGVSASIREQLLDSLIQTPGVRLMWRPSAQPPGHHRSLATVDCQQGSEVAYYVGIETRSQLDNTIAVAVRALDPSDGSWVSGFGLSWQGRITAKEQQALHTQRIDPYLRGLRPLPFETDEADLIAGYLARNLSCLMRASGSEDLILHVASTAAQPPYARTTLDLVGNYLSRYREVRVTSSASDASHVLSGKSHKIDNSLHQFWAVIEQRDASNRLPGMDTAAYVRTVQEPQRPHSTQQRTMARHAKPIVHSFRALAPRNATLCADANAWINGERVLAAGETFPLGGCYALEVQTDPDAELFLVQIDTNGRLSTIDHGACDSSGAASRTPRRWPPKSGYRPHGLRLGPGEAQTFYALALSPAGPAEPIANHLAKLDSQCGHTRLSGIQNSAEKQRWLGELDQLMASHGDLVAWRSLRITGPGDRL